MKKGKQFPEIYTFFSFKRLTAIWRDSFVLFCRKEKSQQIKLF